LLDPLEIAAEGSLGACQVSGSGYKYDAAGDLTGEGTYTYQWDAEARLIKAVNGGGTPISVNTYNALGQRVRDVSSYIGNETTDEAYGAGGNLLWRNPNNQYAQNQGAFAPFNGRILTEYSPQNGTLFDHPDELSSLSSSTGAQSGQALGERLYYPFGQVWNGTLLGNLGMHQIFAQLPDYGPETDQYNTPNRHYAPYGRWMSPDSVRGDLTNPQSLDLYSYVTNNPTTLTDPTGLCGCGGGSGFAGAG
jgi:RHS repeat-associated protein